MKVFVTEIERKGSQITIKWEESNENTHELDKFAVRSTEPTQPQFSEAWDAMKKYFRQILELPAEYGEKLSFTKIKFSRKEELESMNFTGSRALKNAKGVIKEVSPWYSYDTADEQDQTKKKNRMSKEMWEEMIHLQDKALRYVQGERAQLSLFEEEEEKQMEMAQ